MRHFEDYELEHLKNHTGSLLVRLRIRLHLKRCELCRRRYEELSHTDQFLADMRRKLAPLEEIRRECQQNRTLPPEKLSALHSEAKR